MASPSAEALVLGRLVRDFCWDWAPRNLTSSEHTLRSYRKAVALYLTWLSSRGVTPETLSATDFSAEMIEGWLGWLSDERGNTPRTCNARLAAIRRLLSFVSRREPTLAWLSTGASQVEKRTGPKRKVEGMTREAVAALMGAPDQSTPGGRRDLTIMVTLYTTACRVAELLALRVSDLTLDGPSPHANLTGKGNKSRVAYLPDKAVAHLRRHVLETLGADPDPDAYVFWSRNHPRGTRPLSPNSVTKALQKHAATAHDACAEVPLGVTPHIFRHSRASHWLDEGMSVAQGGVPDARPLLRDHDHGVPRHHNGAADRGDGRGPGRPRRGAGERRYKSEDARSLLAFCGLERP